MAILIINHLPKSRANFEEWLADLNEELYMVGPEEALRDFEGLAFKKVLDIKTAFDVLDTRIYFDIIELFKEKPFRVIIALQEAEIIRAGLLREALGLTGQHAQSAIAFRDKIQMKQRAQQGGIPVGQFKQITKVADLYNFIEKNHLPVVVKPMYGSTSAHITVLHTKGDLYEWLKVAEWQNMMIETFTEGTMYHVNGIVLNGKIVFICSFGYLNNCLAFNENKGMGEWMLSQGSPLHLRLVEFTEKLLTCMPTPPITTFHLEVFHTPQDEIVLCEIACRTGGGAIAPIIQATFGIEMDRYVTRAQCGLIDNLPPIDKSIELMGSYWFAPKHGILISMPESIPFDWCVRYEKTGKLGQVYRGPAYSVDNYAIVVVRAQTETELLQRIEQCIDYVENATIWDTKDITTTLDFVSRE